MGLVPRREPTEAEVLRQVAETALRINARLLVENKALKAENKHNAQTNLRLATELARAKRR